MTYAREKAEIHVPGNSGPRLDKFELKDWAVGDRVAIPLVANKKGALVPESGFNVKAANLLYAPSVFRKWKDEGKGVMYVQRTK